MISSFIFQYKQAWLSLKKRPGFIATVVSTMGITLGALICVLTLAYLLLFQPLPYPEQERLYEVDYIKVNQLGADEDTGFNFPSFYHLYENQKDFDEITLLFYAFNVVTSLPHQPTVPVAFVTPEIMTMLNIPMEMGRQFDEREARETNHPVVILNYDTWQKEFSADPNILTQKIGFKGRQYEVIGVTGKNFIEPQIFRQGINTGIWFPWDFHLGKRAEPYWGANYDRIAMIGKLKKGLIANQVEQSLTPIMTELRKNNNEEINPIHKDWTVRLQLTSLSTVLLGESSNAIYFLLAGVSGLVLIASANITNLFVSRTAEQQRKLAIQAALGAKKSQLVRLILAESSLLMALSVILALFVSSSGFYLIKANLAGVLPRIDELTVNAITFSGAVLFASVAALFFSYISSQMINYRALNTQLQSSGKGTGVQVSKGIRQTLIASQVAIAMVLVFANLSLFNNAIQKINAPTGFNINNIMHASFSVSSPEYPDGDVARPIMLDLQEEVLKLPQVESADLSYSHLASFFSNVVTNPQNNETIRSDMKGIGDEFFNMSGQSLIEGNFFEKADFENPDFRGLIVNDRLAEFLSPNESVIGKTVLFGEDPAHIIGVVKGIKLPNTDSVPKRLYFPLWGGATKMNIKLLPNQTITRTELVTAVKAVTPLYALYGLENLKDTEDQLLFSQYTTAVITASLAIITLLLAAIGLYGILSYGTQMRRFELGTRMAIGAKAKDLVLLLIKDNSVVILIGIAVSLIVLIGLYIVFYTLVAQYLSITLLGVYLFTLITITLLCLFACYWPLRQYIKQPAIYSLRGSD